MSRIGVFCLADRTEITWTVGCRYVCALRGDFYMMVQPPPGEPVGKSQMR